MAETMVRADVNFERRKNGYDTKQVDRYIAQLSNAYQEAYDEYQYVCEKYKETLEQKEAEKSRETDVSKETIKTRDIEEFIEPEQTGSSVELIKKTLINAEILAEQLINDAKKEAAFLKDKANQELAAIVNAKKVLISEINNIGKKLEVTGIIPKESGYKVSVKTSYNGTGVLFKPNAHEYNDSQQEVSR